MAAACDGPSVTVKTDPAGETQVVTRDGNGSVTTVAAGGSITLGADLPAATPVYPGAAIEAQIASGSTEEGGEGRVVVMKTADPLDKVAAFYDAQARKAGVAASMTVTEADSVVRMYGDEKSGMGSMVAISRNPEESRTEIVITAGMASGRALADMPEDFPPPPPPPPPPGEKAKVAAVVDGRLQ
jgi:hypothetical protein